MHVALHALHYMLLSHICTFALDLTEQEPEELQEPVPAEETNPE
jgi:hypothetical protein